MNSLNVGYVALAARFYPTSVRATGTSWEQGIGRFGAISGAAMGGVLLATGWSFNAVFGTLCVPMAIGMVAVFIKSIFAPDVASADMPASGIEDVATFARE
jgi:MFS transporter, AAHS family, 4-hydroxybenzoate transporter